MTDSLNARFLWRCYILGCILLPNFVMSSRYLPTRRSIPTQLERNERLKELFEHILESERDAHLSAASKYADQLNLIQKNSVDLYSMPAHMDLNLEKRTVRNFDDDSDDDYQERPEYETNRKKTHFHHRQPQQQPWRIELQNYARNMHRGNLLNSDSNSNDGYAKKGGSLSSGIASSSSSSSSPSSNQPRSHALLRKIQNANEHSSSVNNGNSDTNTNFNSDSDFTNDLDWLASNSDLHSMNDYDALYDDVNENKRSSSSSINRKFDQYRLSGTKQRATQELSHPKIHLN